MFRATDSYQHVHTNMCGMFFRSRLNQNWWSKFTQIWWYYPPRKLIWQWKNKPLKMYLLLKIVIFHFHVSFREGIYIICWARGYPARLWTFSSACGRLPTATLHTSCPIQAGMATWWLELHVSPNLQFFSVSKENSSNWMGFFQEFQKHEKPVKVGATKHRKVWLNPENTHIRLKTALHSGWHSIVSFGDPFFLNLRLWLFTLGNFSREAQSWDPLLSFLYHTHTSKGD